MKLRSAQYFAGLFGIILILVDFFGGPVILSQIGIVLVLIAVVLYGAEKWIDR